MKIVVIQLPSILNDGEIYEALQIMAMHLPVPEQALSEMKCDILPTTPKVNINPAITIAEKCDTILNMCIDSKSGISTITNFWSNVANSNITKQQLTEIMKHPSVASAHLRRRNAECFFNLFETALKHL